MEKNRDNYYQITCSETKKIGKLETPSLEIDLDLPENYVESENDDQYGGGGR